MDAKKDSIEYMLYFYCLVSFKYSTLGAVYSSVANANIRLLYMLAGFPTYLLKWTINDLRAFQWFVTVTHRHIKFMYLTKCCVEVM